MAGLDSLGFAEEAMTAHFALVDEGYNGNDRTAYLYAMKSYNKLAPIPLSDILAYGIRIYGRMMVINRWLTY